MTDGSAPAVSEHQKDYLSLHWHDKPSRLISHGKKAIALTFLEQTIERSLPLFRTDSAILASRGTAWRIRTHQLLEWNSLSKRSHGLASNASYRPDLAMPGRNRVQHDHALGFK